MSFPPPSLSYARLSPPPPQNCPPDSVTCSNARNSQLSAISRDPTSGTWHYWPFIPSRYLLPWLLGSHMLSSPPTALGPPQVYVARSSSLQLLKVRTPPGLRYRHTLGDLIQPCGLEILTICLYNQSQASLELQTQMSIQLPTQHPAWMAKSYFKLKIKNRTPDSHPTCSQEEHIDPPMTFSISLKGNTNLLTSQAPNPGIIPDSTFLHPKSNTSAKSHWPELPNIFRI